MKNQKTMGNKGFSLVELIVVIAIMVVLVAVLAPTFTKYVEQSRRGTDVQNASAIADAVLADAADGTISKDSTAEVTASNLSAIKSQPKTKGNAIAKDTTFTYEYTASTNSVIVYVTGDKDKTDLASDAGATAYKAK